MSPDLVAELKQSIQSRLDELAELAQKAIKPAVPKLQLVVGGKYKNRKGDVVKITGINPDYEPRVFQGNDGRTYTPDGQAYVGETSSLDLVEVISEPKQTDTVPPVVGKHFETLNGSIVVCDSCERGVCDTLYYMKVLAGGHTDSGFKGRLPNTRYTVVCDGQYAGWFDKPESNTTSPRYGMSLKRQID
jgi:hypothetical protein